MTLTKNKIIIALSVAVAVLIYIAFNKEEVVETLTTTKIEYIPETSTIIDLPPVSITPTTIKVPVPVEVTKDSIVRDTVYMDIEAKKYTYKDSLPNGVITSNIIADNIYRRDVQLETFQKKVTTKTTNTIVQSSLFLNVGINRYINTKTIRDVNVGIDYTMKNKWRAGLTGGYDFIQKDPFVGIKVGVPLN